MIQVDNADIMATLITLKAEVEQRHSTSMRMVFSGGAEAHLLAEEICKLDWRRTPNIEADVHHDCTQLRQMWEWSSTLPDPGQRYGMPNECKTM